MLKGIERLLDSDSMDVCLDIKITDIKLVEFSKTVKTTWID